MIDYFYFIIKVIVVLIFCNISDSGISEIINSNGNKLFFWKILFLICILFSFLFLVVSIIDVNLFVLFFKLIIFRVMLNIFRYFRSYFVKG